MNERVRSIQKYYTNLEYENEDKIKKSTEQIENLTSELSFLETDTFAHRFLTTASTMEENLDYFMSVSENVDSVLTILDYLYNLGAIFKMRIHGEDDNTLDVVGNVLITLYYMYQEYDIQKFLENIIVGETELKWYYKYKRDLFTKLQIEMILCENSDLHAVINYLKLSKAISCLKIIWLQKSIKDTFMWHLKKNIKPLNPNISIQIFQSKQELITSSTSNNEYIFNENITLNVVSIWSEDITAAKNLARSLNQNLVFINAYMDIFPGIVLFLKQIFQPTITCFDLTMIDKCTNNSTDPTAHKGLTYNLFYDGMWQKPKKNTYWIHKDILFASATSQDIIDCIKSATRGFKNLSTMSNNFRRQMLSKFATTLECHGKLSLSEVVSKWINLSYIYGKMTYNSNTERFEVTSISKPKNTVILKEEDEISLFQGLTQNLIIGNSVIVICNPDLYILAPYCNMFEICGIPPGIINLLSIENANNIKCDNLGNIENVIDAVLKLTMMQYILVPYK